MRLTAGEHARIRAAIETAERRTSGEIFCVLAKRVSSYRDVSLGWATAAALLLPLALVPLGFEAAWLPGVADSWETAHLAARDAEVGQTLAAYAVVQAAILITVFLITCIPTINRWVTPGVVRQSRVRRAALQQFLAHGLQDTENRTGVLIFAALSDHQVEVVADQGIHSRVDPDVWVEAVSDLTQALRQGRPADGFEAAIARVGAVLAEHFPPGSANRDELPNRLIQI